MSKRIVLVAALVIGVSFASFAGVFDTFLDSYSAGNLHTLIFTDPVKLIKLTGEEPASYDYYSSGEHIFTYIEADSSGELSTLGVIWEDGSIEEIRVGFTHHIGVDDALKDLGYGQGFFSSQETTDQRLGDVPYHARQFRAEDAVIEHLSFGTFKHDAVFIFLLNHFDDSVYMLIIQHN